MKKTTKQFIFDAEKIYGKKKYDYSFVKYINNKTKVKIICYIHGEFFQRPNDHLSGKEGCRFCRKFKPKKTTEIFIKQSKKIHFGRYDYSLVRYKGNNIKVKIICPKHGVFEQAPFNHINGHGCPKCANEKNSNKFMKSKEQFIIDANKIHKNRYDYSLVDYRGSHKKIKIICPKHGIFEQKPYSHLLGRGCPVCKSSKGELKILEYLRNNNILFEKEKKFLDCRGIKMPLSFDFYLPEYNTCIEFDGKQHFEPYFNWNKKIAKKQLLLIQKNDNIKNEYCKKIILCY